MTVVLFCFQLQVATVIYTFYIISFIIIISGNRLMERRTRFMGRIFVIWRSYFLITRPSIMM